MARSSSTPERAHAVTSGILLAWSAALLVPVATATGPWTPWAALALVSGLAGLLAAQWVLHHPRAGRWLASMAAAGFSILALPTLLPSPAAVLAGVLAITGSLALLWNVGDLLGREPRRHALDTGRARGSSVAAVLLWLLVFLAGALEGRTATVAVDAALGVAALLAAYWAFGHLRRQPRRAPLLLGAITAAGCVAWVSADAVTRSSAGALLAAFTTLFLPIPPRSDLEESSWLESLAGHPERLFVGTFALLCVGGAALLSLPQSAAGTHRIGALDALFTSVSAVCVTGLTVLDTAGDFSWFGQFVILVLIQVGGLGIMTFSTAALRVLGRRLSLRHEQAVASLISPSDRSRLFTTARSILALTFAFEGIGAAVLFVAFLASGDSVAAALWRAVFTAVSAFCNAGFALQATSLIPYRSDPLVLHVVAILIIAGGLSPASVLLLPRLLRRNALPLPTQSRINLVAAAVLLVVGFAFTATFEWSGALADLSFAEKIHNAWFQSVTLRTAGFNSVDMTALGPATLTLMMLWMFIGGSPGGTAGGIKTTTAAVLVLGVVQAVRGRWTLEFFERRISERTRHKAAVTVTLAAATLIAAVVAMQLTQTMSTKLAVFEVVSALGTVGLTLGGTAQLDSIGKFIILSCMFVGRVGGLTALLFLSERERPSLWERPEEEIDVG